MEEIWQRRDKEPNLWFRRFEAFRRMGPRRSYLAAYNKERAALGKEKTSSLPRVWLDTAHEWNWVERAQAWDEYKSRQDEAAWEKRYRELRRQEWEAHAKLLEKAQQMLVFPLAKTTREEQDGKQTVTILPTKWGMADAAKLMEAASKLGRLATGNPTESVAMDLDLTEMAKQAGLAPETLQALYEKIKAEVARVASQAAPPTPPGYPTA
jgi:hypothetical protein